MPLKQTGYWMIAGIVCLLALLSGAGCAKDFSFEQTPVDTMSTGNNNTPLPAVSFCSACTTAVLQDSSWQVTIDNVVYCGKAEKAILTIEKTAFTFFGPSSCSVDSGFVASVYIENESLNADKKNVRARLACYYYDRIEPAYVYMSAGAQPLQLIITTYDHSTGRTRGTFSGFALDKNGNRREVKNGQFDVIL